MQRDPIEIVKFDDIEIQFFDEDPDGAPDRAGDGWYFRLPGDESWSGAWHSEEEAEEEARDEVHAVDLRSAASELLGRGFCRVTGTHMAHVEGTFELYGLVDGGLVHVVGIGEDRVEAVAYDADALEETVLERRELGRPGVVVLAPCDPEAENGPDRTYDCVVLPERIAEVVFSSELPSWPEEERDEAEYGHVLATVRRALEAVENRIAAAPAAPGL